MRAASFLLLIAACGVGLDPRETGGMDGGPVDGGPEAQVWLDAQNAVRRTAQPTPNPPLPPLTWLADAAAVAQTWADRCNYAHNAGRGMRGENIAATAPAGHRTSTDVVGLWASESQSYDYASNTCASGQQCGHYTQIVWRTSTRAGCAHRACATNSPFASNPTWDFWVCDYEPPGNFVGQRPY
jgi:hypothetical protein